MDAFAIDQAVWKFGEALSHALNEAEEKGKNPKDRKSRRAAVIARWLSTGAPRHRDPAQVENKARKG